MEREIPQFHRLAAGDEEGLGRLDAAAAALVHRVAQPVAAAVGIHRAAAGLPGDRPVLAGVLVPQVNIMAGPVHRHPVGAKAGDAVMLRALVKEIPARRVVDHPAQLLYPEVVGPGNRQIHPVDDILAVLLVKMAVLHCACLLLRSYPAAAPLRGAGDSLLPLSYTPAAGSRHASQWFLLPLIGMLPRRADGL